MARPAIPASAISLSMLPDPASAAGAAAVAAVSGSVGSVYEMGFTAGVATVHVGGTDNAPTVFASPRPAAMLGGGMVPGGRFRSVAGNGSTGAGPTSGQACSPFHPLTMSSVCKPVPAPMMSKGRATTPRVPNGMSAAKVAMAAGASRKMLIRLLNVLSGSLACAGAAAADVAALVSALGTAENACWTVLCTLPAEVPVDWLTAAAWLADPPGLVF